MYQPQPIDTDEIQLPEEITALIEQLAANSHEVWAKKRISQGWVYGPQRDDAQKQHPELRPYEGLTDEEKAYDRLAVQESIKVLLSLGVTLNWQDVRLPGVKVELPADLPENTIELYELWLRVAPHFKSCSPVDLARLVQLMISQGEPLMAYEILSVVRPHWEEDLRLAELQALALNRVGASYQAIETLEEWVNSGHIRPETLGILSRAHKDLALKLQDEVQRSKHLKTAYDLYYQGYELALKQQQIGDLAYTGTNAASLALLQGDAEQSRALAKAVIDHCGLDKTSLADHHYWLLASVGECALLLGDMEKAEACYRQAAIAAKAHSADLASMSQQATWVLQEMGQDTLLIQAWMGRQTIALFVGQYQELSQIKDIQGLHEITELVIAEMTQWLKQQGVSAAYASARPGVDLLFHLALKRSALKSYVILPRPVDAMKQEIHSKYEAEMAELWLSMLDQVLEQADEVHQVARDESPKDLAWFDYELGQSLGMAMLKADELDAEVIGLSLWPDEMKTASSKLSWVLNAWMNQGMQIYHHDPVKHEIQVLSQTDDEINSDLKLKGEQQIVAMLFSDVKGFSQLSESQVQHFHALYWELLYEVIQASQIQPAMMNSWGDGFFMVFEHIPDAARLALIWQEKLNAMDWSSHDLPDDLNTRMALHAGPAKAYRDPIHQQLNYVGTHVSHTARLEPVTPPGQIYATREFAALSMRMRVGDYHLEYAGRTGLAKNYGEYHAYLVVAN